MNKDRFVLQKSTRPMWWVLTDSENGVVLKFEQHKFNETQEVTILEDFERDMDSVELAKNLASIMQDFGQWMRENAYHIGMPLDDCRAWCSVMIRRAMEETDTSKEELALKSGFRERNIEKVLDGEFTLKVYDFIRLLSAMGKRIVIK